jgi:SAM-dependent methyltransferase
MSDHETDDVRDFWNRVAEDWKIQVGTNGDSNRILNSDPVLWNFVGTVEGVDVLDAGCGTGYLSKQLCDRGAHVTGIDLSERMIAIARTDYPGIDFRVDSCATLHTIPDANFDLVVANYVLMDARDLEGTIRAFYRVLRRQGGCVVVFSHPCFPQGGATPTEAGGTSYHFRFPYFERTRCVDPPWAHFTSEFIWFHRPLSDYWKSFKAAGFDVLDFEEPRITKDRYHLVKSPRQLVNGKTCPYSVAFKLRKN